MNLKEKYSIDDLLEIMAALRGENGCPWDKVQTHESIKKNLIEECYEAIDAYDSGDNKAFANELGDVLLQVVFHAQIAKERGAFDFDDILYELCTKLITRHTHVFGEDKATNAADALTFWEKSKKREKSGKKEEKGFGVPRGLPALMRTQKIQKRAEATGCGFGTSAEISTKIADDLQKISGNDKGNVEEAVKDILFQAVALARSVGVDAETALDSKTQAFVDKFAK